jgi:hypothetical protein
VPARAVAAAAIAARPTQTASVKYHMRKHLATSQRTRSTLFLPSSRATARERGRAPSRPPLTASPASYVLSRSSLPYSPPVAGGSSRAPPALEPKPLSHACMREQAEQGAVMCVLSPGRRRLLCETTPVFIPFSLPYYGLCYESKQTCK